MSNEEKILSGKYMVVPKWRHLVQLWGIIGTLITVLATGIGAISYWNSKADLTFDTQNQKQDVIDLLDEPHPIKPIEAMRAVDHTKDADAHMTFDEKAAIIRIEENQVRIGQDLQELKNLIRKNY